MRLRSSIFLAFIATCSALNGQQPSQTVTLAGQVNMPDGAPASNARVVCVSFPSDPVTVQTDAQGHFALQSSALNDVHLIAASQDHLQQSAMRIDAPDVREWLGKPIRLELQDAREIEVHVHKDGRPIAGAEIGIRDCPLSWTKTDSQGHANSWVPADRKVDIVWAFHPTEGVALWDPDKSDRRLETGQTLELSMHPTNAHLVNVTDQFGDPVAGVTIGCSVNVPNEGYALTSEFPSARRVTNSAGEIRFEWFPDKLRYVDADVFSTEFVLDRNDFGDSESTAVGLRRRIPITGKIEFEDEKPRAGILVTGRSFGPHQQGHITGVRTDERGEFTLMLAPDHAYTFAISDRHWGSDLWSGIIAETVDLDRKKVQRHVESIQLVARPTLPAEVIVTHVDGTPLTDKFVLLTRRKRFHWFDASGKKKNANGSLSRWIKTNEKGVAGFGFSGACEVRVSDGDWRETQKIDDHPGDAIRLNFVRPAERHLVGRVRGESNQDWTGTKVVVLISDEGPTTRIETTTNAVGDFQLDVDGKNLNLFAVTQDGKLSGVNSCGPNDDQPVELRMMDSGIIRGMLVNSEGEPIANRELRLDVQHSRRRYLTETSWVPESTDYIDLRATTDTQGHFTFDAVPSGVELLAYLERLPHGSDQTNYRVRKKMLLEPGEVRENILVKASRFDAATKTKPKFDQRLSDCIENAKIASMRVLVLVPGSHKTAEQFVYNTLMSSKTSESLDYLFTVQSFDESNPNRLVQKFLQEQNLQAPAPRGVVLAVFDGDGELLETQSLRGIDREADHQSARRMLQRCAPPRRDAKANFAAALTLAMETDRKVLIQAGGPRCGPCFSLAKWLKTQHTLIERDYVVLKIDLGRDKGASDVEAQLAVNIPSIPWMAIVGADGSVLADSKSRLGNIGFPGGLESLRHFRKMLATTRKRLSDADLDTIVESRK